MNRRDFLKSAISGSIGAGLLFSEFQLISKYSTENYYDSNINDFLYQRHDSDFKNPIKKIPLEKIDIKNYLDKMRAFNQPHEDDIIIHGAEFKKLRSIEARLRRLHKHIGYQNFHILSFDEVLNYARRYPEVGSFSLREKNYIEQVFYTDASVYGFYGKKTLSDLTSSINRKEIKLIPHSGNFVFQGPAYELYEKIKMQIGPDLILTSGVRSVMKQLLLYFNKAIRSKGNLSLASRSLAPPGYSFHGISDFDVGKKGFGIDNFTSKFVTTEVYKKLEENGHLQLRYPLDNLLGVRFEPWHIKVRA